MGKALRYILRSYVLVIVGSLSAVAAVALVGARLFRSELFTMYYTMLPMFAIVFGTLYGFSLATLHRGLVLSFGGRRADFFWACQVAFALCAAAMAAILALAGWLTRVLPEGYFVGGDTTFLRPDGTPAWFSLPALGVLGLLMLLLQPVGIAMGEVYSWSKGWGSACVIIGALVMSVLSGLSLFIMDGTIPVSNGVAAGVLAGVEAAALLCEVYFYRSNARAVVR